MNYSPNNYFNFLISYNGAGAITIAGQTTFLNKFENNNNGSLFKATATLENRTGPDTALEINPVGSGGVEVNNVIMQDNQALLVYGSNTLTVDGTITTSGTGTAATVVLEQGATVIFKGVNTYTGDTFVNNGNLQIASGGGLSGSSAIRLGNTASGSGHKTPRSP